jgi:P pilus assembly chaperone PapD
MLNFTRKIKLLSTPMHSSLSLAASLLSAVFLWAGATQAQVSLSPMIVEIQSIRGQAKGVINITNTSDETFRARVYAESFTYDKEKGFQTIPSNPNDLRPYLQFSPRELVIPPGTTRNVRMSAILAPNLPNGEYRAMIFTEPLKQSTVTDAKGITTTIITRVGSAFFVRKGDVRASLTAESARWNTKNKQLQLLVRNTGKASTYSTIKWSLKQGGTVVKTGESPSTGIVPESDRYFTLNASNKDALVLSPGTYQLSGDIIWGENKNKKSFKLDLTVPSENTIPARIRNRKK